MSTHKFLFVVCCFTLLGCTIEAEQIVYGNDQCNFCKMNIVDQQHAAQYVTSKGKQFKFDAIECMVAQINEVEPDELPIMRVSDFGKSNMIDATTATFLISAAIKSPMGANLSAFGDTNRALETQKQHSGEIYNWKELKTQLQK